MASPRHEPRHHQLSVAAGGRGKSRTPPRTAPALALRPRQMDALHRVELGGIPTRCDAALKYLAVSTHSPRVSVIGRADEENSKWAGPHGKRRGVRIAAPPIAPPAVVRRTVRVSFACRLPQGEAADKEALCVRKGDILIRDVEG